MQREQYERGTERLAKGLGWFSIGLGLAEVGAPRAVARLAGVRENGSTDSVMRALGVREIAHGLAILSDPSNARWVWTRVGGDIVDLSILGSAFTSDEADRGRLAVATAAVLGVAALDVLCAGRLRHEESVTGRRPYHARVEEVTTINRPLEEVYRFWRNFENFPRFIRNLESVQAIDERRSRWRAKAPAGMSVEWEAEIVQEVPDEWIAWRSVKGSDVDNSGSVRFTRAPGARGTELRVQMQYSPPAGALGRGVAWLFGKDPEQQIREDLHRVKQLIETGEIPISEGPGLWRAAQPPADPEQIKVLAGVHS